MDVRRHVAVSAVVSILMLIILKRIQVSVACFLTGILTDLDHVFDLYVNSRRNGESHHFRRFWNSSRDAYRNGRPFRNVYKFFHGVELLIPVPFLYIFGVWNDIATGMLIGFALHLAMDFYVLGHPGSISLIFLTAHCFFMSRSRRDYCGLRLRFIQKEGTDQSAGKQKKPILYYVQRK